MRRQARLDSPGTLHHVIVRGINKRRCRRCLVEVCQFIQVRYITASEGAVVEYGLASFKNRGRDGHC